MPRLEATTTKNTGFGGSAIPKETCSNREAVAFLDAVTDDQKVGKSKVNKSLTKQQTWDIFHKGIPNDDKPLMPIVFRNINREFGRK